MGKRRYEILLPVKHNNGTPIAPTKIGDTRRELLERFGGVTSDPSVVHGDWISNGRQYSDEMFRIVVDVDDTDNRKFFKEYQALLRERFDQIQVYIVSYLIDVV